MQKLANIRTTKNVVNRNEKIVLNKNNGIVASIEECKRMLKKDIVEKLKKSEQEIENGEGLESDEAFKKLRQKFFY